MNHLIPGSKIEKAKFVPFEDILGVGHEEGFNSIIVQDQVKLTTMLLN